MRYATKRAHVTSTFAQMPLDRSKTLEQLDGQNWGPPAFGSNLVTACHRLRRVPLERFRAEDFRLMLGQRMSLEYLVPASIAYLNECPLASGDFHPGDMLEALLRVPREFWATNPKLRDETDRITQRALQMIQDLDEDDRDSAQMGIRAAYGAFQHEV